MAVRKDAFMNSLVIEEAGVILKSKGMVTLTKENLVLVSVFKNVQPPQIKSVDCTKTTCKRYGGRTRCSTEPKIVNETSTSHWFQEHARSITTDYKDRFNMIRDSFTSQLHVESKRPKRWAAFQAAGLSLLT